MSTRGSFASLTQEQDDLGRVVLLLARFIVAGSREQSELPPERTLPRGGVNHRVAPQQ